MQTKRNVNVVLVSVLAGLSLLLSACGSSGYGNLSSNVLAGEEEKVFGLDESSGADSAMSDSVVGPETGETQGTESENDLTERKLIRNASLTVESKTYDEFLEKLQDTLDACGGYVENLDSENSANHYSYEREAYLVIRIPSKQYDDFMGLVSEIGNVIRTTESVDDVTLTYIDIESHIKALRTEEESLLRLMEQAESLSDLLTVQSRLTEVRYQIESYQSQLNKYDNLIAYSTIKLTLYEVKEETVVRELSMWEEIGQRFLNSCSGVVTILKGFVILLIGNLPYILFAGVVILVPIWIIIFLVKRSEKRKANKMAVQQQNSTGEGHQDR